MFRHSTRTLIVCLCALAAAAPAAPALAGGAPSPAPHTAARALHTQTLADLTTTTMRGEAYAHAAYSLFAAEADRQGLSAAGQLFRTTAQTELNEHLREAATLAGTVGSSAADLRQAINGETYEHQVMYRRFAEQARADGDFEAAKLFSEIAADEGRHRDAFRTALTAVTTGRGTTPAPPKANVVPVPAGLSKVKAARTKANLDTAMHGEALAHAKYMLFAAHAQQTGEAALAGLVRTTRENLRTAITGEHNEATTVYPEFAKRATAVGDAATARYFRNTAADEARHAAAFQRALDQLP